MLAPDVDRLCKFSMLPVRKSSLDLPIVVCFVVSKLLCLKSPKSCMAKGRITLQAIAIPTALDTLFSSSDMRLNATPRSSLFELITQCKESTFPSKTPIARYISDCETVSGSLRFIYPPPSELSFSDTAGAFSEQFTCVEYPAALSLCDTDLIGSCFPFIGVRNPENET